MKQEELFAALRSLLAEALVQDEEEVQPDSRLVTDLGADSLDFMDILFRIEKQFGVKIQPGDFNFLGRPESVSSAAAANGLLTTDTIQELQKLLPALKQLPEPEKVTPAQLFSLISVETLCVMIERGLATQQVS